MFRAQLQRGQTFFVPFFNSTMYITLSLTAFFLRLLHQSVKATKSSGCKAVRACETSHHTLRNLSINAEWTWHCIASFQRSIFLPLFVVKFHKILTVSSPERVSGDFNEFRLTFIYHTWLKFIAEIAWTTFRGLSRETRKLCDRSPSDGLLSVSILVNFLNTKSKKSVTQNSFIPISSESALMQSLGYLCSYWIKVIL